MSTPGAGTNEPSLYKLIMNRVKKILRPQVRDAEHVDHTRQPGQHRGLPVIAMIEARTTSRAWIVRGGIAGYLLVC